MANEHRRKPEKSEKIHIDWETENEESLAIEERDLKSRQVKFSASSCLRSSAQFS